MDRKVSVSQFLQQARRTPGAKPPPLPRQPPPPPLRPGWPSSGRVSAALLLGLGLFGLVAFVVAGEPDRTPPTLPAAPPAKQPPVVARSDAPPSPAPDHTPVRDFRDVYEDEIRGTVTATAVTWSPPSQQIGFKISNANPFPVRDVDIGCRLAAPSGTVMGDAVVTVYEIVPANAQKIVRVLVNEFFEINTYRFSPVFPPQATRIATCSAAGFASMADLEGVPVKTDAQLKAWCTRYHRCGL